MKSRKQLWGVGAVIGTLAIVIIIWLSVIAKKPFDPDKILSTPWAKFELKALFPYKKDAMVEEGTIRNILQNLDDKPSQVTKDIYIDIKIILVEKPEPATFFISQSGWGVDPYKCDCYSYKDKKAGKELYDKIFNQIQNYLTETK